ncbi:MAG: DUF7948 domain-containing protein [Eubacteriales bacterium]
MIKPWRIKTNLYLLTVAIALFGLPWVNAPAAKAEEKADQPTAAKIKNDQLRSGLKEKTASLRLPFIFNQGQIAGDSIKFYAKTFGGTVYVTMDGELVYSLPKFEEKANDKAKDRLFKHQAEDITSQPNITKGWSLKEQLVGALSISPQGIDASQTKINYFIGDDKSKWRSNIATYNTVSFGEVYLGIDLSLKARGKNVEKVFIVNPGADVNQINLRIEGATSLKLNGKGELEVGTGLGVVCFTKPVAYQEKNGQKEYVQVTYHLNNDNYGFTVENYDKSRQLIIDPLLASTYIGGSSNWDDVRSLALDSTGNVYVAGVTQSADYPTTVGAYDLSINGYIDVFVSKLDANLNTLISSTFVGGSKLDGANSLAIDSEGNVYIAGYTSSADFPATAGSYDPFIDLYGDAFIIKFDANLSNLLASTFLGGSTNGEYADSLVIDNTGNVYVAGITSSTDYPTTAGAYDTSYNGGAYDVFISKLDANLSHLLSSTFVGGSRLDEADTLAIENTGNIYILGQTYSTNYPTTAGAYDTSHNGGTKLFISKFDTNLAHLLASTFIGGSGSDYPYSMAIDNSGNVFIAGDTASIDFPTTTGAYCISFAGGYQDAFMSKLDPSLGTLLASTFLGGTEDEGFTSLSISREGYVYVSGWTWSNDFPTTAGAYDTSYNGGGGEADVIVSKFDADLSHLMASTFIGGCYSEGARSMAIDRFGNIYVAGVTNSSDYPTTEGAYNLNHIRYDDTFISKLTGDLSADIDKSHLGKRPYCLYGKGSVNLSTGNYILEETDLAIPSIGPSLELTRFYNSTDTYTGPLGAGWTHNYNTNLTVNNGQSITVTYADGHTALFTSNGTGYVRPAGCFETLEACPEDTYVLTFKDQTKYTYNVAGQLTGITDKNNNTLTLAYTNGLLSEATEPSGRKLTFTYNADNRLAGVTDPSGRNVFYDYDSSGNLNTVKDVRGGITRYNYNNLGLTEIIAPDGNILLGNDYDSCSRVTRQTDGRGNATGFNYDLPGRTAMTDALGKTVTADYDDKYRGTGVTYPGTITETYTYDDNNCNTGVTDALNRTTKYNYDDFGNLLDITGPAGNVIKMTYDGKNNLLSVTNAVYKQITFTYDENNNLKEMADPFLNTTSYDYHSNGLLRSKTTPAGGPGPGTTCYTYRDGLLQTVTDPAGNTTTFGYDAAGRPDTITDSDGKITAMNYDEAGNLLDVTDPLGNKTSYTYDWRGSILTKTDAGGNLTRYAYNGIGQLLSRVDALNNETRYEYDVVNRLVKVTDPRGSSTIYSYDPLDRLTGVTNPLGYTFGFQYDAAGNLTGKTDAMGKQVLTVDYDLLNNPLTMTDALGNTIINEYDSLSRLTRLTDPMKNITGFDYDDVNRLKSTTDALSGQGRQEFDAHGNREAMVDPNTNRTIYSYDTADRPTGRTTASGQTTLDYNTRNLVSVKTNARGQTTTYEYDAAGRLKSFTNPDGTVSITYDQNGSLLTAADSAGTTQREYDALNRIIKFTDTQGNIIEYAYDANGNLITLIYPGGRQVQYEYNAAGRLVKVTDWAGRITSYEYDPNGRLIKTVHPNGASTSRDYDEAGRLVQVKDVDNSGGIISQFDYIYFASGNFDEEKNSNENVPFTMSDAALTYAADNRLATYNGQAAVYDADGNMTTGPLAEKMENFSYDTRGRLTGAGNITYTYDAGNNRIRASDGPHQTNYIVNPNAPLSQVLIKTDEQNNQTFYVYGLGLIGQESPDGAYRTYHFDSRGNTTALTNESGNVTDRFQYAPYGEMVYRSGSTATPFLFSGRYGVMTDASDLYYMRARYYNPVAKRFLSPDTLTGYVTNPQSQNLYTYCEGNPVMYVDPTGHYPVVDKVIEYGEYAIIIIRTEGPIIAARVSQYANQNTERIFEWILEKDFELSEYRRLKRIRNLCLAGKPHPITGVPFDEEGFPIYESKFDIKLDPSLYRASDPIQFKEATKILNEVIKIDPTLKALFTEEQLEQIASGLNPRGFTWHHHQELGRLQLVDSEIHSLTGHTGGRAFWCGGR